MKKGFTLVEILVVITVFAVLGVITTQTLLISLQGSRKSGSLTSVRENLNYALSVMERQLRNAESVVCTKSTYTNITYNDENGKETSFSCLGDYIASGSARLTSSETVITACEFTCNNPVGLPSWVGINLTAKEAKASGTVSVSTQIQLRTY